MKNYIIDIFMEVILICVLAVAGFMSTLAFFEMCLNTCNKKCFIYENIY